MLITCNRDSTQSTPARIFEICSTCAQHNLTGDVVPAAAMQGEDQLTLWNEWVATYKITLAQSLKYNTSIVGNPLPSRSLHKTC